MYKTRREKFIEMLPDYSITVLFSGHAPYSIGDEKYPFKVDRGFYYFTGIERENLVLMLVKAGTVKREVLFIEHFDEVMAKWVGGKIKEDEAKEVSGIESVDYVENLERRIGSLLNYYGKTNAFTLCGDFYKQELTQSLPAVELFNRIKTYQPDVKIMNIFDKIVRLRMNKDEREIAFMKKAIAVTKEGIETMMRYSHDNVYENELEAYFDFVLKCNQCNHAFNTICATGKNATILHYSDNNQYAKRDEMVLIDLGAAYKLYSADISRTFPVNGKFTDRQRQIYDIVLRANKLVESIAKPGMTTRELNDEVVKFYEVELKNIGLLEDGKTVSDYYWHGVSHMLGLETHDVSLPNLKLEAGCVITNEPGLYLEDEAIGVRIEDDLLITEDGCICLSKEIIKEIDEIEAFMKKN